MQWTQPQPVAASAAGRGSMALHAFKTEECASDTTICIACAEHDAHAARSLGRLRATRPSASAVPQLDAARSGGVELPPKPATAIEHLPPMLGLHPSAETHRTLALDSADSTIRGHDSPPATKEAHSRHPAPPPSLLAHRPVRGLGTRRVWQRTRKGRGGEALEYPVKRPALPCGLGSLCGGQSVAARGRPGQGPQPRIFPPSPRPPPPSPNPKSNLNPRPKPSSQRVLPCPRGEYPAVLPHPVMGRALFSFRRLGFRFRFPFPGDRGDRNGRSSAGCVAANRLKKLFFGFFPWHRP